MAWTIAAANVGDVLEPTGGVLRSLTCGITPPPGPLPIPAQAGCLTLVDIGGEGEPRQLVNVDPCSNGSIGAEGGAPIIRPGTFTGYPFGALLIASVPPGSTSLAPTRAHESASAGGPGVHSSGLGRLL
jgi:hypothetical protein